MLEDTQTYIEANYEKTQAHLQAGQEKTELCLKDIQREITSLQSMINKLSRSDAESLTLDLDAFDISEVVDAEPEQQEKDTVQDSQEDLKILNETLGKAEYLYGRISTCGSVAGMLSSSNSATEKDSRYGTIKSGLRTPTEADITSQMMPPEFESVSWSPEPITYPSQLRSTQRTITPPRKTTKPVSARVDPSSNPLDLLDDLIENYQSHATQDLKAGRYQKAERNLRRALDKGKERESRYRRPFPERFRIGIRLVEAYLKQNKCDMGEECLHSLFEAAEHDEIKHVEWCYTFAKLHRRRWEQMQDQSTLDKAEDWANKSYNLAVRSNISPQPCLEESAALYAEILHLNDDPVAAETIRNRHPSLTTIPDREFFEAIQRRATATTENEGAEMESPISRLLSGEELLPLPSLTQGPSEDESADPPQPPDHHSGQNTAAKLVHDTLERPIYARDPMQMAGAMSVKDFSVTSDEPTDSNGLTPLLSAVKSSNLERVRELITKANINARDPRERTALHLALVGDHKPGILSVLLEHGIDLSATDNDGRTALHYCAQSYNSIAPLLLDKMKSKNLSLDTPDQHGETALQLAVHKRNFGMVTVLLHKGAATNDLDWSNASPEIKYEIKVHLKPPDPTRRSSSSTGRSDGTSPRFKSKFSWGRTSGQ